MKRNITKKIIRTIAAALLLIFVAAAPALAADTAAAARAPEFNQRLTFDLYAGTGIVIPKEGNLHIGPTFLLGAEWRRGPEAIFLDATFAETDMDTTLLWDTSNARHTTVRLGYKAPVAPEWRFGANIQTQRMDFGLRKLTSVTCAALVEYNPSPRWAIQLESAQVVKKSGIRFNSFSLVYLHYLHGHE